MLANYAASQLNSKINEVQKQIGARKKVTRTALIRYSKSKRLIISFAGQRECR